MQELLKEAQRTDKRRETEAALDLELNDISLLKVLG